MINEWISLRWERGTRYYEAHLHQDLWGDWVLTQVWGRRGTELGRMVHTPCASYQDGRERLTAVQARREQRGYKVREVV
jgi:predicted DNA-binding WGR domain protein